MTTAAMPTPLKIGQILNIPRPPVAVSWPHDVSRMKSGAPQNTSEKMYGMRKAPTSGDDGERQHSSRSRLRRLHTHSNKQNTNLRHVDLKIDVYSRRIFSERKWSHSKLTAKIRKSPNITEADCIADARPKNCQQKKHFETVVDNRQSLQLIVYARRQTASK